VRGLAFVRVAAPQPRAPQSPGIAMRPALICGLRNLCDAMTIAIPADVHQRCAARAPDGANKARLTIRRAPFPSRSQTLLRYCDRIAPGVSDVGRHSSDACLKEVASLSSCFRKED
jgi:hypothetical protein